MSSNSNKLLTLEGRLNLKARGDNHPLARAVITPAGRFGSCGLAADHHGISKGGAKHRADNRVDGWGWEDQLAKINPVRLVIPGSRLKARLRTEKKTTGS